MASLSLKKQPQTSSTTRNKRKLKAPVTRTGFYKNNPNLPRAGYVHTFTIPEQMELMKCTNDPVYFTKKYVKIVTLDYGIQPFALWDFQEKLITGFHENRFSINKLPRQVGKTSTAVAYILHYILFNDDVNVAILANKLKLARDIMSRLQLSYELLPPFLKNGVVYWNKSSIKLDNGSKVQADSTTGSSIRGESFNLILLDEFAHVATNIAQEFFMSTYPTISSGKNTKVIIVSTPKGMNMFYDMWTKAQEGKNDYIPFEVHWSMVPGRDEAWKEETIRNTSEEQFEQEFNSCDFSTILNTNIGRISIGDLYEQLQQNQLHTI